MAPATTPTTPAAEPANAKPVGFAPESDVLEESEVDAALFESLPGIRSKWSRERRWPSLPRSNLFNVSHAHSILCGLPITYQTKYYRDTPRHPTSSSTDPGSNPPYSRSPRVPIHHGPRAQKPHGAPVVMVLQELATLLSAAGSGRTRRPRSSRMRSRIVGSRLVAVAALPVAGGSLGTGGGEAGEEGGGGDGALHCGWYCVYTKLVEEDGKCRSSNDNGDNSPNDIYLIPRNADMLTSQAESQKRGMSGTARFVSMLSPTNTVFAFARHHQVCSHAGQRDHHGDLTRKVERLLEPSHPIEPRSPGDGISTTSSSTPFGFHSPGSTSSIVN
ncbi:hypothetical protein KC317_g44 [Hortaea werneckii]|nr:hypothetical protein KC317_g44 [Hortaea werneckii]